MTEYTRQPANVQFGHYFTQLIFRGNFPGTEQLNSDILNFVLGKETDRTLGNANTKLHKGTIGGWQPTWPDNGILDQDEPCIKFLKEDIIMPSINLYAQESTKLTFSQFTGQNHNLPTGVELHINSWSVLYRKGNFQCPHLHRDSAFTGIYYPAVPENLIEPEGAIVFHNSAVESSWYGYDQTKIITPKAGDLIIFPSWVTHQAYPFSGDGHRLSIVFDVFVTGINE